MPESGCHPPTDDIVTREETDRVTFLIGQELRMGPFSTDIFDRAHERIAKRTGLPTSQYSTDQECGHGEPYMEVTISADRSARTESAEIPPAISYFGNAPTRDQGEAYKEEHRRWQNDRDT